MHILLQFNKPSQKGRFFIAKKIPLVWLQGGWCKWLRVLDLNQRPYGYEPYELPTAPTRNVVGILYKDFFKKRMGTDAMCHYFYTVCLKVSILLTFT